MRSVFCGHLAREPQPTSKRTRVEVSATRTMRPSTRRRGLPATGTRQARCRWRSRSGRSARCDCCPLAWVDGQGRSSADQRKGLREADQELLTRTRDRCRSESRSFPDESSVTLAERRAAQSSMDLVPGAVKKSHRGYCLAHIERSLVVVDRLPGWALRTSYGGAERDSSGQTRPRSPAATRRPPQNHSPAGCPSTLGQTPASTGPRPPTVR